VRAQRVVLLAVLLGVGLSAGSAGATSGTKLYGASVSPASVPGNARVTYTLTLSNESTTPQAIGSADFWAPAGWTVNSVPASVLSPDSHTWNISSQTNSTAPDLSLTDVVLFRAATNGDKLDPGQSVSASVDATAPCAQGPATWQTQTKQANDFSGAGNDIEPAPGDVNTTVAVGPAALGSFTIDSIGTQKQGVPFTVTVTAYDTCGVVKTDYSGGAALTGNLTGISSPYSLSWGPTPGVGTANLTPTAAQLGAQVHVQDGTVGADSNPFDVLGAGTTCTATSGSCQLTDENGTTTVKIPTPSGDESIDVGLLPGSLFGTFTGCSPNGPLAGESIVTIDPHGYTGPFTMTLVYGKKIAPGTGVPHFVVCKSNDGGATWEAISPCDNQQPVAPCILHRSRTGVGDLVETLLVSPEDPAWGTD
jgi:hypothetical protein